MVAVPDRRQHRQMPVKVPATELCVREWLIRDLRSKGYRFREIGELFGLTRQRVYQIERHEDRRASKRSKRPRSRRILARRMATGSRRRLVSVAEFNKRLGDLNARFEKQLLHILERRNRRPKFHFGRDHSPSTRTLFWKVWPCIERYAFEPFSFSNLVADYPRLAREPLLPQLLSRLRKQRLLKKVGLERTSGHNLPEVLMVEASIDEYVAPLVEKLVVRWSRKLMEFQRTYAPTHSIQAIDALRELLIESLLSRGMSRPEIASMFGQNPRKPEAPLPGPIAGRPIPHDRRSFALT